jgi:ankyrin repeat protein
MALLGLASVATLGAAGARDTLVDAAKAGDVTAVRALLEQGRKAGTAAADGTTALHWAAYRSDADMVDLLLRSGVDVKAANRYGATALSLACETSASGQVVGQLLKAGADPNTAMPGGATVLMAAARTGNIDAVTLLVASGANVNATEPTRGQTALMWAAGEGHADVIKALVTAGADIRATSRAPAAAAQASGDSTYRRSVARIDVFTPYLMAVRANRLEAAAALLDAGVDVNETTPDGTSALVLAIHNAHFDMASFLLDRGADPNAARQGWTPLHQLLRVRSLNIGFFPHPEKLSRTSPVELATKLLDKGADVNARLTKPITDGYRNFWNQMAATPILMAAKGADAEMMRLLLERGADPSLSNASGTTPLMAASGVEMFNPNEDSGTNEEALECVTIAVEAGGDVNQANKAGDTALHGAAWRGANDIIQLLVDKGARLDAKNRAGLTPLQIANGEEEGRVANVNIRPWSVELLVKLMKERGLPIEMKTDIEERFAFEKQQPRKSGGGLPAGLDPARLKEMLENASPEERERIKQMLGLGGDGAGGPAPGAPAADRPSPAGR